MGIAIFFLLGLVAAGVIAYPLLPGRTIRQPAPAVSDADIERAVRDLRQARGRAGLICPSCGKGYEEGDRFCVQCGSTLPQEGVGRLTCPSCGSPIRGDDQFCAKCGHRVATEEVA
jgi:predicted amidophosphoribosyltransferase